MKLLDTWQWQIHMSYVHAQCKYILLDARVMQEKFTGCMAVASARIIRAHTLHGANSWSVKKNSTLLNQSDCRDS